MIRALVVGSTNIDLVLSVTALPAAGETVLATSAVRLAGGKGANQAVALARLGAEVMLGSCVGDDGDGRWSLAELAAEGVTGVAVHPTAPTGLAVVMVDAVGENSIVVSPGANAFVAPVDADVDVVLLSLEVPLPTVAETARLATAPVVLNAAPWQPLASALLADVDVLVVNEVEAAHLGEVSSHLVVTLGASGAVVDGTHVPAESVQAVDTTGAGDCFAAALAFQVGLRTDLVDAAAFACRAAGLSVGYLGARAGMPTLAQLAR
ncbi:MAG: ribokinase [Mycobacteriales bacterium]